MRVKSQGLVLFVVVAILQAKLRESVVGCIGPTGDRGFAFCHVDIVLTRAISAGLGPNSSERQRSQVAHAHLTRTASPNVVTGSAFVLHAELEQRASNESTSDRKRLCRVNGSRRCFPSVDIFGNA